MMTTCGKNALRLAALLAILPLSLLSWNPPVKIDGVANHNYFDKTAVQIANNGSIYVCYADHDLASNHWSIKVALYNGKSVTILKDVSETRMFAYEPDMAVGADGSLHVVWAEGSNANADQQYIKYRRFSGTSWSSVQTLQQMTIAGTIGGFNPTKIGDLRLAADRSGNLAVVFMIWPAAKCYYLSRYGESVRLEGWPLTGRSKHPDVAIDSSSVHITWQHLFGTDYAIAYSRRPNSAGGSFSTPVTINDGAHRPRVDVDPSGTPHLVHMDDTPDDTGDRNTFYTYWTGKGFSPRYLLSDDAPSRYQNVDLAVANGNNALMIENGGTFVLYNWKVNGNWSGHERCPTTLNRPDMISCDLSGDAKTAAIAFINNQEGVYLTTSGAVDPGPGPDPDPDPTNQVPVPAFTTTPSSGAIPLTVTFDGSGSYDPDGQIVTYNWDFGDGTVGVGQIVQHVYNAKGTFLVKLTVIDNAGASATGNGQISAIIPNIPPVARFTFTPTSIIVPGTVHFDASASTDADGVILRYDWDYGDGDWGSGQTADHLYRTPGPFTVRLIIRDDNTGTASASGLLQAFPIQPPLNIQVTPFENRNLFSVEYGYEITWERNPRNDEIGARIAQYKVYRYLPEDGTWQHFQTVDAASAPFRVIDRIGSVKRDQYYTVTAIDADGRESLSHASPAGGAIADRAP